MKLHQIKQLLRSQGRGYSNLTQFASITLAVTLIATSVLMPIQAVRAESAQVIEEIVVTARKREESLQDTPVVISALSAKTINDFAIESMEDIADFTPGLLNVSTENQAGGLIRLRGIGSATNSPIVDQAISLVVDDMQIGSLQIQRGALIDMESVQVYKGPQALFFGKNSPGGVLSIRTADPGDAFEAQLKTGYEVEAEEWFAQGMVSGPISDTVAGRLVVRYTDSEGFFDVESGPIPNSFDGKVAASEDVFVRGTLLFEPTDDLAIRTKLTYTDKEGDSGSNIQRFFCPLGAPQNSLPFNCEADNTIHITDIPQEAIDLLATAGIKTDATGNHENDQVLLTVSVDYDFSDALSLSSTTGYYELEDSAPYNPVFGILPGYLIPGIEFESEQFTQELRLASDFNGPVNFVAGVFYETKDQYASNPLVADLLALGVTQVSFWAPVANTEFDQNSEAYSVFVDLAWDVTENLELSGGVRYSYEEKDFTGFQGFVGDAEDDWNDVSPQVTLSYRPNDEWMLYASYREGFKSGGHDGSFQFAPVPPSEPYNQETVEGFELGAKGLLLNGTLQLNAAIYSYEYEDLQLSVFDSATLSARIFNAAAAEIAGVELDVVWLTPVEGLLARGAIAYNDNEFKDFAGDCYNGQTIALGCNLNPVGGVFQSQDLTGNPLSLAPEIVGNLGLSYETQVDNVVLGLTLDAFYTDDFEPSTFFVPGTKQDSHTKINAAIRLSDPGDAWYVALIGRNLTDEYQVYSVASVPSAPGAGTGTAVGMPGDFLGYVGTGRTLAAEVGYTFR